MLRGTRIASRYVHFVFTLTLSQSHLLSLRTSLNSVVCPLSFVSCPLFISHLCTHTLILSLTPFPSLLLLFKSHTLTLLPPSLTLTLRTTHHPSHKHTHSLLLLSLQCGDDESVWGCNRHLTLDSYVAYGGWPFCKPCYTKNFKQGTYVFFRVVLYWSVLYCIAYFS